MTATYIEMYRYQIIKGIKDESLISINERIEYYI